LTERPKQTFKRTLPLPDRRLLDRSAAEWNSQLGYPLTRLSKS
jgi:hypothetical protein